MPSRDTNTGKVLEETIIPARRRGGYKYLRQVEVGRRPGGRKHFVDVVILGTSGKHILVSTRWQ